MLHLHREAPALGHQHASKRDELVFLRIIETREQGLGRFDDLLENCPALRDVVRLAFKRSIGEKLSPCSFCSETRRALAPSLTANLNGDRTPKNVIGSMRRIKSWSIDNQRAALILD
jgi:hypothetical protein